MLVGYLAAVVMPLIGFILGLVMVGRGRKGETLSGLIVMILSIAVGIAACSYIANQTGKEIDRSLNDLERDTTDYDQCLKENNYRFRDCRDLDPLK